MLYFHAARKYTFTMNSFIHSWDKPLAEHVISVPYGDLDVREPVPAGTHIFADFERLLPAEIRYVQAIHDRMVQHPDSYDVLNSPARWSGRLGLNQALTAAGRNDYRAFRIGDVGPDLKFPAFVRWENEHSGSLGDPVMSHQEIKDRADEYAHGRHRLRRRKLLVIEQLDARGDDGLYRKYSAMKIGDELFPRHICHTNHWVTKFPTMLDPELNAEELEFVRNFPHADEVNEAFELAGLDYGRIDYGFVNGRMQVWEINTNPIVMDRMPKVDPERLASQEPSGRAMLAWLRKLAENSPTGPDERLFGRLSAHVWQALITASHRHDASRN